MGLRLLAEERPVGSGKFEPVLTLDSTYYASLGPVMDTARELNLPVSVMVSSIPTIFSGPGNSTDGHNASWFVLDPSDPSFNMDRFGVALSCILSSCVLFTPSAAAATAATLPSSPSSALSPQSPSFQLRNGFVTLCCQVNFQVCVAGDCARLERLQH